MSHSPDIVEHLKKGFGIGVGVSLATWIFGPPRIHVEHHAIPTVSAFEQCIAEHRDDVAVCAHLVSASNPRGGQTDLKK